MADKMMRIAGRTSGGVAKALHVSTDGEPVVERKWGMTDTQVFSSEIRDTNWHSTVGGTTLDISSYPINSLRIRNTTEKAVTIRFLNDLNASNETYLNHNGSNVDIELVGTNNTYQVFTPQDIPVLNYLHYLKFQVKCTETPTSGSVVVYHCGRK